MLDMIQDMIKEYRELYPNEEVPEEILFDVSGRVVILGGQFWAGGFGPPNIRSFWAVLGTPLLGGEKKGRGLKKRGRRAYFLGDILILK